MNKPWEKPIEEADAEGNPRRTGTAVVVSEVVLPKSLTKDGEVPFGVVVPLGGSFIPGTDRVTYPKGYFARPVSAGGPREVRARLDEIVNAPDDDKAPEGGKLERLAASIVFLAEALFSPYYGKDVVDAEILPRLPLSAETAQLLAFAAMNSALCSIEVKS